MQALNRTAILVALLCLPTASNAAKTSQVTDYCLVAPLEGGTGRGSFHLGDFVMKARLTISDSHYVLEAWNVMPDNSQVLEIHADGTYQRNGPTRIRFIDNFSNRGRGTFTATKTQMKINIDRVKATPEGQNIGRNYGSYPLSSRGCKWTDNP
jgi:hypothetical protein